jgi:hypothetical protein
VFDFHSLAFIEAWVLSTPSCVAALAISALLAPACQPNFLCSKFCDSQSLEAGGFQDSFEMPVIY